MNNAYHAPTMTECRCPHDERTPQLLFDLHRATSTDDLGWRDRFHRRINTIERSRFSSISGSLYSLPLPWSALLAGQATRAKGSRVTSDQ